MKPETRRIAVDICIAVSAVVVIFFTVLALLYIITDLESSLHETYDDSDIQPPCNPSLEGLQSLCNSETSTYKLVETIPYGDLNQTIISPYQSTTDAWIELIQNAQDTIYISCSYFSLNYTGDGDYNETLWDNQGHDVGVYIYELLIEASSRGVTINVVQNQPGSVDSLQLDLQGVITLRLVDIPSLTDNGGILHTKFIIVDERRFYLGSANMDWRSLTQVKELGIVVESECLTQDLLQIWKIYWESGILGHVPVSEAELKFEFGLFVPECNHTYSSVQTDHKTVAMWPFTTQAFFNQSSPALLSLLDLSTQPSSSSAQEERTRSIIADAENDPESNFVYISSVPEDYCSPYRTNDLKSVLGILRTAQESISVSVMYYSPTTLYTDSITYWAVLDDALRQAAVERGVKVRLMVTDWNSTIDLTPFWKSLDALDNIEVRIFVVPEIPGVPIPHARVNHAKFLVTEREVSLTTSNWSADYFLSTLGVSFNTNQSSMISEIQGIFDRDWDSPFCYPLST